LGKPKASNRSQSVRRDMKKSKSGYQLSECSISLTTSEEKTRDFSQRGETTLRHGVWWVG